MAAAEVSVSTSSNVKKEMNSDDSNRGGGGRGGFRGGRGGSGQRGSRGGGRDNHNRGGGRGGRPSRFENDGGNRNVQQSNSNNRNNSNNDNRQGQSGQDNDGYGGGGGGSGSGNWQNNRNLDNASRYNNQSSTNNLMNMDDPPEKKEPKKFTGRCRLFVGNMSHEVDEDGLKEMFTEHGEISEVFLSKGKGFGFIRLDTRINAMKAKEALDGTMHKSRILRVRFATHGAALKVSHLPPNVSNELLEEAFGKFGELERAVVIVDDRGRSTGEGIIEYARKNSLARALQSVTDGVLLLTSSPRPVTVEPLEQRDEEDGLEERYLPRNNSLVKDREQGPRMAPHGSFEFEFGQRWKQLYEMEAKEKMRLKQDMEDAIEKLELEMTEHLRDHQANKLREELRRIEELKMQDERRRMEVLARREDEQRLRRENEERGMMQHQREHSLMSSMVGGMGAMGNRGFRRDDGPLMMINAMQQQQQQQQQQGQNQGQGQGQGQGGRGMTGGGREMTGGGREMTGGGGGRDMTGGGGGRDFGRDRSNNAPTEQPEQKDSNAGEGEQTTSELPAPPQPPAGLGADPNQEGNVLAQTEYGHGQMQRQSRFDQPPNFGGMGGGRDLMRERMMERRDQRPREEFDQKRARRY